MHRLIFLIFLIPSLCFAGGNKQIINMMNLYNAASGYDVSNFTFWWDCEAADFSGTNGTTNYSAGDDTATLNGNAAINTDAVLYGTNGLDLPSADNATFNSASIITDDDFIFAFAWKANSTWPTDNAKLIRFWDSGDGDEVFVEAGSSSGVLNMYYEDDGVADGTCTVSGLSVDTWYFIIGVIDQANDDVYLYIYNTSKSLVTSDSDLNTSLTAIDGLGFRIGDDAAVGSDMAYDHLRIDQDASELAIVLATMDSTDYSNP